jgi:hypothetical protein
MQALAWPSKDIGLDAVATGQAPYWPLRLMAWCGTVVFMSVVVGPWAGAGLALGAAVAEGWTWLACRPYAKGLPGTPARRRMTMGGVLAFAAASTIGMLAFWYGGPSRCGSWRWPRCSPCWSTRSFSFHDRPAPS